MKGRKNKTNTKITDLNPTILIITLNVNRLQLKGRYCQIFLKTRTKCMLETIYFKYKESEKLKVKGFKRTYQTRSKKIKKAGVAIFISKEVDFITREREGHFIMIKS